MFEIHLPDFFEIFRPYLTSYDEISDSGTIFYYVNNTLYNLSLVHLDMIPTQEIWTFLSA